MVVSNLKDMRQFVERFHCGRVADETDPISIAEAIRQVVNGREDYVVGDESRRQIEREFGWQAQSQRLRDLYANLFELEPAP